MKHLKLSSVVGGSDTLCNHFGNTLLISYKIKHILTCQPAITLLDHCPNEMKTCSQENFHVSVHNGFIHNNQKPEPA